MRRMNYSTKRNQMEVLKSKFGKLSLQNDVIHEANKVNWNLKKIQRYFSFSAISALEVFDLKLVKLRRFSAISVPLYIILDM
jgi:hypothetical protein